MAPPNAALHTRTRVSTPFELMMRKSVRKIGGTSPSCAASMRMPSCAAVNSLRRWLSPRVCESRGFTTGFSIRSFPPSGIGAEAGMAEAAAARISAALGRSTQTSRCGACGR
eukprot:scaffold13351_cov112-Isochrysis_galbana.AAC.1